MINYPLMILNTTGDIISCLSCLIVLIFATKNLKGYNLIIFIMLVCDFISSLTDALSWFSYNSTICSLQIIGTQLFALSSFIITGLIIWYLRQLNVDIIDEEITLITHNNEVPQNYTDKIHSTLRQRLNIFLLQCFLIPLITVIIIFSF